MTTVMNEVSMLDWQVYMKGLNDLGLCSMQYVTKLALIVCLLGLSVSCHNKSFFSECLYSPCLRVAE